MKFVKDGTMLTPGWAWSNMSAGLQEDGDDFHSSARYEANGPSVPKSQRNYFVLFNYKLIHTD